MQSNQYTLICESIRRKADFDTYTFIREVIGKCWRHQNVFATDNDAKTLAEVWLSYTLFKGNPFLNIHKYHNRRDRI